MKNQIKKISIRYWVVALFSIVAIFSAIATGQVTRFLLEDAFNKAVRKELSNSVTSIQKMVKSSLELSVHNHLKGIAQANLAILGSLQEKVQTGRLAASEAKQLAKEILLGQPIGDTGYIYTINSKGTILIHPNAKMTNRDMSVHWLAQKQIRSKQGYLEYAWRNPGEAREQPKALYMDYFEPWDWIVSVSSYQQEFASLLNIRHIEKILRSYGSGESRYALLFNTQGICLAGSDPAGRFLTGAGNGHWKDIHPVMLKQKSGQLVRKWKDRPDQAQTEKLILFDYMPEMGWIVVSLAHVDDMNSAIADSAKITFYSIIGILAIVIPFGFFMGLRITRPFVKLLKEMKGPSSGNFNIRADESAYGECGQMAGHLNHYLDNLTSAQTQLQEEIRERAEIQDRLRIFEKVVENAMEGITITDPEARILKVNDAFCNITGYQREEAIGQNPRILKSDRHNDEFYRNMWQQLIEEGSWRGEIWNRRKNGEAFPEILSISAIRNDNGGTTHYVAVFHDISEMKVQQEKIKYQAFHDALTGLPNRYLAQDRLTVSIKQARRHCSKIAVLFIDMDNFKLVNDSLGHTNGDLLLQQFGKRLKRASREQDTVARLGGDEFLVIVNDIHEQDSVVECVQRLMARLKKPFSIAGQETFVTVSIGISVFPDHGDTAEELIKHSDMAMYQSKSENKNNYHWFTRELSRRAIVKMNLTRELREAICADEFQVYYQPKIDPGNHLVSGMEALVRWEKSDGSIVSPAEFIPLAEETGLIVQLGQKVLQAALAALQVIRQDTCARLTMAVNLSPQEFRQPEIVDRTIALLDQFEIPADALEFEITETTMMTDLDTSVSKINALKDRGISVSIDDFGTGYSSLYYLKNLPISTLKIDKSFVDDITESEDALKIVETIILMAKSLGLETVAEGVENQDQLGLLRHLDCELVQGYHFAKPMPLDELIVFLREASSGLPESALPDG